VIASFQAKTSRTTPLRELSALDLAFFLAESENSPKHVAGLILLRKPDPCPRNFVSRLVEELKTHHEPTEPFNLVIRFAGLTGPHWEMARHFDISQHVFYHRPAKSSTWLEVKDFVARLHEPLMDRSRPLWEYHMIDGIEDRHFAVYTKIHHAYADGMTMTSWLDRTLARSPDDQRLQPVWTMPAARKVRRRSAPSPLERVRNLGGEAWNQVQTAGGMAKLATQQVLERTGLTRKAVSLQFATAHDTPLTGSATPGRNIATTFLPMDDIRRVCNATRLTLNHVVLACIDAAMHRHLQQVGFGVDHPLTIQMPVNLRKDGESESGNRVGVALVELADPQADPLRRLQQIGHSLDRVRHQFDSVPSHSVQQYTVLSALANELIEKVWLSNRIPATGHTLVSNVPGPKGPLYLRGAQVEQMYPISILVPGLRTNITLFSCSGVLNFGIVATHDLPQPDLLARYIEEEFRDLEDRVAAG
jgi:diacylglycerol O-acyltransferase